MYYVYLIKRDSDIYIGSTNDLRRRFKQHSDNFKCQLLYYEAYPDRKVAFNREMQLKQFGGSYRALKERLDI